MRAPEPTYRELRDREVRERMEIHRPRLEAEARHYGIPFTEKTDTFTLSDAVHRHEDELKRPELEQRAERLGVRTHTGIWPFRVPRVYADLYLACVREEDRLALLRRYGYETQGGKKQ